MRLELTRWDLLRNQNEQIRNDNNKRIKAELAKPRDPDNEWDIPSTGKYVRSKKNSLRRDKAISLMERLDKIYQIKILTPYQFRFNNEIDIYPTNQKYHILKSGKRGEYRNLEKFLKKYLS